MAFDRKTECLTLQALPQLLDAIMLSSSGGMTWERKVEVAVPFMKLPTMCPTCAIHWKWVTNSLYSKRAELNFTSWKKKYRRICGHSLKPSLVVCGFTAQAFIASKDLLSCKSVHYVFSSLNFNWLHWPGAHHLTISLGGLLITRGISFIMRKHIKASNKNRAILRLRGYIYLL